MAIVPDPATTPWVPLFSTQATSVTLTPHAATHAPGGSDPITGIETLPHHVTHEPGGADALIGAAWTALQNIFTNHQIIQLANPRLALIDTLSPANQKVFDLTNSAQAFYLRALDDALAVVQMEIHVDRLGNIVGIKNLTATGNIFAAGLQVTDFVQAAYILSTGDVQARGNLLADGSLIVQANVRGAYVASTGEVHADGALTAGGNAVIGGSLFVPAIGMNGSLPRWTLNDTSQPADLRVFDVVNTAQLFIIRALNDAQNVAAMQINIDRQGNITGVKSIAVSGNFQAGSISSSGPIVGSYVSAGAPAALALLATPTAGDVVASNRLLGASAIIDGNLQAGSLSTPGTMQAGGLGSTPLNADRLTSGTVPDARLAPNITRSPHGATHQSGGADAVPVTALAGYPGGTSRFLRADGVFADLPSGGVSAHASTHRQGSSDPVSITQGQVEGLSSALSGKVDQSDPRLSDARPPTNHATNHQAGHGDALNILTLAGYNGDANSWLAGNGAWTSRSGPLAEMDALLDRIAALEARVTALEAR